MPNDESTFAERFEKMYTRVEVMDERLKGALHRIDEQTKLVQSVQSLALSVEKLALSQNVMSEKLKDIDKRVESIEQKPARRIDGVIEKALAALIGGFIAFLLARIGIQ